MKTRRNPGNASFPMVGTPRCGVRTARRAVPIFKWRNLIQIWLVLLVLSTLNLQLSTAFAQPVIQIAAGAYDSFFIKSDGSLWAMGGNNGITGAGGGQLGDGTYNSTNRPELIVASNVMAVAAGNYHSLFLKRDGSLWAMGAGYTNFPEQIVASNVTALAAGYLHSLFLKSDGSLWAMGINVYGQLGDGTINNTNLPEQVVASNVTAIAAGYYHSLFIKNDGSLWGMGLNHNGQLGDGTYGGSLGYTNQPEQIVASNVTAVVGGYRHSLFLKNDGSLWGMGYNHFGEMGDGTYGISPLYATNWPELIVASNVTAIAIGTMGFAGNGGFSLFLKSDGSLWGTGANNFGQLGDGSNNNTNRPEQIVATGVKSISGGGGHNLFLKSDGSLWGMGYNGSGELGDGTWNSTNQPEQILGPYNQIQTTGQLTDGTNMQLNFVGIANANYALDRASNLSPPNWIPQLTNAAGSFGALAFTNTPDAATNNFWRIRSVP